MDASNVTIVEVFVLTFCHLLDFPSSRMDCSVNDPNKCVLCLTHSTFLSGGDMTTFNQSAALITYSIIWVSTILITIFGILGNTLIMQVVGRRKEQKSFDILLRVLAAVDIFCCLAAVSSSTGTFAYFGNWLGRGPASLYWFWMIALGLLGRSLSAFITVIITIERFLLITFPLRANSWFTPTKTKVMTGVMIIFASFLNIPRFVGFTVEENDLLDIPSLRTAPYLLKVSDQGRFWYVTMGGVLDQIDFWTPLPLILLFNLLTYWKIREFSKRRKELSTRKKQDIRAVKMFLPVVVVYLVTNTLQLLSFTFIDVTQKDYRELFILLFLSTAANSAVNMPIYYFRSSGFKEETRTLVSGILVNMGFGEVTKWKSSGSKQQHSGSNPIGTNASTSESSV